MTNNSIKNSKSSKSFKNIKSSESFENFNPENLNGLNNSNDLNDRIPFEDVDMEDLLDVMGCRTRREIINLLREEPRFVSEISQELEIGQKAIIEHLRAMEEIGILSSSFKKIVRGRPRKYYDMPNDFNINITVTKNSVDINIT
ncbi:MAG: ArsR family transcriptional regulator, partial [Methanobrevibacter sp.]|nr:ArsR family transcriptional regulator [Methanobrevibacter sp.]